MEIEKNVNWKRIVLVYEPVPGPAPKRAVTAETVNDACEKIRTWLKEKLEEGIGKGVRLLFAGPITETNCKLYLAQPSIDGFLVLHHIKTSWGKSRCLWCFLI